MPDKPKRGGPAYLWFAEDLLRACGIDPTKVTRLKLDFGLDYLPKMQVEMLPPWVTDPAAYDGVERVLRSYVLQATLVEDAEAA